MTPERIAELRALAQKATPGPWEAREPSGATQKIIGPPVKGYFPNHIIRELALVYAPVENQIDNTCGPDAAFIAAARTALPEALDALERVHRALEQYRGEGDDDALCGDRYHICSPVLEVRAALEGKAE